MDELKPSPRNEFLFSLAQKLREAPGALSRANPILGTLARSVLGDIPQGLEHYAYGDSPLGPPANAPMVDIKKAVPMLEATPLAALGALPKGAAMMVPAVKLRDLGTRSRLAEMLNNLKTTPESRGATADKIWEELSLIEVPTPASVKPGVKQFMQELPDEGVRLSPSLPRMTRLDLETAVPRFQPIARDRVRVRGLERLNKGELLQSGEYRLGDALEHPELFKMFPELQDVKFNIKNDLAKTSSLGSYNPGTGSIEVNPFKLITGTIDQDPLRIALHEATHALQHKYGYMSGSSPDIHLGLQTRDRDFRRLQGRTDLDPMLQVHIARTLRSEPNAFRMYEKNPGEIMARESERRITMPPDVRSEVRPGAEYTDMFDQLDPRLMNGLNYLMNQGYAPTDFAKKLREWGSLY